MYSSILQLEESGGNSLVKRVVNSFKDSPGTNKHAFGPASNV